MECLAEQRPQLGKGLASCDDDAGWRRGTAETRSVIPTQPTHIPTARAIKANKRKGVALGRPSIRPTPFAYSRLGRGIERCRVLLISPPISSLRPLWRSYKYSRVPQIASSSAALRTRGTGTTSAQQQEGRRRSPLKRWGGRQTPSGRSLISDIDVSSSHTVSPFFSAACRLLRRKKKSRSRLSLEERPARYISALSRVPGDRHGSTWTLGAVGVRAMPAVVDLTPNTGPGTLQTTKFR